jgi:hypothetical protein
MREFSRSISSQMNWHARWGSSSAEKLSCTIEADARITPSGLRTSWAIPAATRPTAASFSCWTSSRWARSSARSCASITSVARRARWRSCTRRPTR